MTDYLICFNGHLLESSRPEGWPKVVYDKTVFRVKENAAELADYMNGKVSDFQHRGGMTIGRGDIEIDNEIESDKEFGNGLFVPMHMIAFMSYTVKRLVGAVPPDDNKVVM